ncbi:MAG TPA: hypothetical protein VML75_29025 [Kofleriaceae bacterium]|nr:hypothetical protein [Kofleriaceae bacterium]
MRFRFLVIALGTMLLATACGGSDKPYLVPVDSKLQPFNPPEAAALTGEKEDLFAPIDDDDDGDDDDDDDTGEAEAAETPATPAPAAAPEASKSPAKAPAKGATTPAPAKGKTAKPQ